MLFRSRASIACWLSLRCRCGACRGSRRSPLRFPTVYGSRTTCHRSWHTPGAHAVRGKPKSRASDRVPRCPTARAGDAIVLEPRHSRMNRISGKRFSHFPPFRPVMSLASSWRFPISWIDVHRCRRWLRTGVPLSTPPSRAHGAVSIGAAAPDDLAGRAARCGSGRRTYRGVDRAGAACLSHLRHSPSRLRSRPLPRLRP